MRTHVFACALVIALVVAGVFQASVVGGWIAVGAVMAAGFAVFAGRCRHPYPALQPSTVDFRGERTAVHWYCADCGHRWPAHFEHDTRPVQRFTGFDPSKAVRAARRASELETRRRELAVARSGQSQRTRPPVAPVPIDRHRSAAR